MRLISVVMGASGENTRAKASQTNLNYGYRFYETHKLYNKGDVVTNARVWKANTDSIELTVKDDFYITIPRGQYDKLDPVVEIDKKIIAPIRQGERQGVLNIFLSEENIASVSLLAKTEITRGSIFNRLKDEIHLFLLD